MAANVPVTMTVSAQGVDTTTAALARVTASVDRMRRMQTSAVAVGNVMASAATRTARAVYSFGREAINSADGIAKSARAFGLSGRGYQEMAFAAQRSGIGMSQLDVGIKTMQARMVTADAVARQLGVSFDHIKDLSPEAQFREVGRTLAGIQNPAQRTALAVEMFGRQGAQIAEMSANFDGLAKAAHEAGAVMSDGALKTAERFNDVLGDMKAKMQAAFVNNLPDIQMFMQSAWAGMVRIYDTLVAVGKLIIGVFSLDSFLPLIHNIIEAMERGFINAFENLRRLISATIKWVKGQGFDFQGVGLMEGAQFKQVKAFEDFADRIFAIEGKYDAAIDRIADARIAADKAVIEATKGGASAPGGSQAADRQRGLEAAQFGSVEAARAINRMRGGAGNIEQRQLAALERISRNTEDLDGGIEVMEFALP